MFLWKGVLKICIKFTGEHPCRSVISIKLQSNFIEIALWHGCSVNLLHIFRTPFHRNTSRWLLLKRVFLFSVIKTLCQVSINTFIILAHMSTLWHSVVGTSIFMVLTSFDRHLKVTRIQILPLYILSYDKSTENVKGGSNIAFCRLNVLCDISRREF